MNFMERIKDFSKEKLINEIMSLIPEFSKTNVKRMIWMGEKLTNDPEYKKISRNLLSLFENDHPLGYTYRRCS